MTIPFIGFSQTTIEGKWKTFDIFNRHIAESIVDIRIIDQKLTIRIDSIIPEDHREDLCTKCEGDKKDQPIWGMVILKGAELDKGVWKGAKILNAKNGLYYGCHLELIDKNLLKVRGYIGYPLFGKNLYWKRFLPEVHH